MALVAAPSHRIHSIHGAFDYNSPNFGSYALSLAGPSPPSAAAFTARPNVSCGPRFSSQPHPQRSAVVARARRPSLTSVAVADVPTLVSTRRAPPPPIRVYTSSPVRTSPPQAYVLPEEDQEEDPFADPAPRAPFASKRIMIPASSRPTYSSYSYPVVSPPPASPPAPPRGVDRTAAARLVATVLLGRSNSSCGTGRRRMSCAGARAYTPSCLSRMVAVEC